MFFQYLKKCDSSNSLHCYYSCEKVYLLQYKTGEWFTSLRTYRN